jgi:predicted site-specific integrase-resolvase
MIEEEFMTPDAVSKILGVSLNTLENWRREKKGLPFCKFQRHVRYRSKDVINFIERNSVQVA